MNKEEILIEDFIKSNPFDFKQGIISHCRQMDKLDVFEWVAEDELKIQQLQQENQQLHNKIDKAIEYMKDFIFEPLLVNEDRKLIMFNENLRNFEEILKDSDVDV